ncbi:MAG TPA: radical SAM protein [Armatimonadota bacterium]
MVSLGPLSSKRYCTYSCPFCYVSSGFPSYVSMPTKEIVRWLRTKRTEFDIIYLSGDTDSLAPPRQSEGLRLLEALSEFGVDLLFTTRAIISPEGLKRLEALREQLAAGGKLLFGCVSVAQWTVPHVEPRPIPLPQLRLDQLRHFRDIGLVSVLAMRPFLPNVPRSDYSAILDNSHAFVDVVLGEVWYVDEDLNILRRTLGESGDSEFELASHSMDFDGNDKKWLVYHARDTESLVASACRRFRLPFFMRSAPAINWARSRRSKTADGAYSSAEWKDGAGGSTG